MKHSLHPILYGTLLLLILIQSMAFYARREGIGASGYACGNREYAGKRYVACDAYRDAAARRGFP